MTYPRIQCWLEAQWAWSQSPGVWGWVLPTQAGGLLSYPGPYNLRRPVWPWHQAQSAWMPNLGSAGGPSATLNSAHGGQYVVLEGGCGALVPASLSVHPSALCCSYTQLSPVSRPCLHTPLCFKRLSLSSEPGSFKICSKRQTGQGPPTQERLSPCFQQTWAPCREMTTIALNTLYYNCWNRPDSDSLESRDSFYFSLYPYHPTNAWPMEGVR